MSSDVSLLIVGGGAAGVTAALQGRELGARVTILEADQIGGTSLNRGPAPVRTLARAARLIAAQSFSSPHPRRVMRPKWVPHPGASKAITLLMPVGLPRISSGACSGG